MKRIVATCLTLLMLMSIAFAEPAVSGTTGSSLEAMQVVRKTKRKGKYVYRKSWNGTRWVYVKTRVKTKGPRRKTWRTGRKVVSRTKKVIF